MSFPGRIEPQVWLPEPAVGHSGRLLEGEWRVDDTRGSSDADESQQNCVTEAYGLRTGENLIPPGFCPLMLWIITA